MGRRLDRSAIPWCLLPDGVSHAAMAAELPGGRTVQARLRVGTRLEVGRGYVMAGDIIHIIGFPGIGKLTIARELIRLRPDLVLVDNHLINNPIFSVVRADGRTPLPEEVWAKVAQIRDIVLSAMETLCPPGVGFVMTNVMLDDAIDRAECAKIEAVAARRGGRYIPVLLTCDLEENRRRIVMPGRRASLKCINPEEPDHMLAGTPIIRFDGHPHRIALDVTHLGPEALARSILLGIDRLAASRAGAYLAAMHRDGG